MGGKSSQKTVQNQTQSPWAPAQPLLKEGLNRAMELFKSGELTPSPYGNRLATESPWTVDARQMMANQALAGSPTVPGSINAYNSFVNGDPYRDLQAVEDQALARAVPAAAGYFENSGMLNSSAAARGIGEAAAGAIAPLKFGAWSDERNRALSALGMAPMMADLPYSDATKLAAVGMSEDARKQAELSEQVRQYYETEDNDYENLARLSSIGLGFGGAGGSTAGRSTAGEDPGAMGTIGSIAQIAATVLPLFFMSDRRLKENIRKVGEIDTSTTVPVYTYNYKGDPEPHIGVMADEVPKDKVATHPSGYKMVNYGAL